MTNLQRQVSLSKFQNQTIVTELNSLLTKVEALETSKSTLEGMNSALRLKLQETSRVSDENMTYLLKQAKSTKYWIQAIGQARYQLRIRDLKVANAIISGLEADKADLIAALAESKIKNPIAKQNSPEITENSTFPDPEALVTLEKLNRTNQLARDLAEDVVKAQKEANIYRSKHEASLSEIQNLEVENREFQEALEAQNEIILRLEEEMKQIKKHSSSLSNKKISHNMVDFNLGDGVGDGDGEDDGENDQKFKDTDDPIVEASKSLALGIARNFIGDGLNAYSQRAIMLGLNSRDQRSVIFSSRVHIMEKTGQLSYRILIISEAGVWIMSEIGKKSKTKDKGTFIPSSPSSSSSSSASSLTTDIHQVTVDQFFWSVSLTHATLLKSRGDVVVLHHRDKYDFIIVSDQRDDILLAISSQFQQLQSQSQSQRGHFKIYSGDEIFISFTGSGSTLLKLGLSTTKQICLLPSHAM